MEDDASGHGHEVAPCSTTEVGRDGTRRHAGERIALSARSSRYNFYDAMTASGLQGRDVALRYARRITGDRGTHFDPDIADAFESVHDRFEAIRLRLQPSEEEKQRHIQRHQRMAA